MNVKEMIERSRQNVRKRTHEQRMSFLQKARILDDNGYYREDLFSQETVAASKNKVLGNRSTQYNCAN